MKQKEWTRQLQRKMQRKKKQNSAEWTTRQIFLFLSIHSYFYIHVIYLFFIIYCFIFYFFYHQSCQKDFFAAQADDLTWGPVSLVVRPGGGGAAGQRSEVRRWNVTFNGHLMTKEMCDTYIHVSRQKAPKMSECLGLAIKTITKHCWIITRHLFYNHHPKHFGNMTSWRLAWRFALRFFWHFAAVIFPGIRHLGINRGGHSLFYYRQRRFITWLPLCY